MSGISEAAAPQGTWSTFVSGLLSEEGAAAVEYGLLVALIAVAIIATVATFGLAVNGLFTTVVEAADGILP